jgi:UPF0755 protein
MNDRKRNPKISLWEYPAYALVSLALLAVGGTVVAMVWIGQVFWKNKSLGVIAVIALILALVAAWSAYTYYHTTDLGDRLVSIIIKPGDTFEDVAARIVGQGVVTSRLMLSLPARYYAIDERLSPGRYDFTGRNSCRSVLDKLARADFLRIRVTIPEGVPVWKAASILKARMEYDSAAVIGLARDASFLRTLNVPSLEGYLFPETYIFPWGTAPESVLTQMVQLFHERTDTIWPDTLPLGLSRHDIIKLASIIEAETRLETERARIASVYLNRLKLKMKLDADPTVIYGLGGAGHRLTRADLKTETPYNTYRLRGLPPTPINSPGLNSIKAALNPEATGFLYFVADGTGGHYFSRTNEEHNKARRRFRSLNRTN